MNAILLAIPIILIRFGLLYTLNKEALKRAAFFPPLTGGEKIAYWFYQLANILIFLYLFFLKIRVDSPWFSAGMIIYSLGIIFCIVSISNFAKPEKNGINLKGLYQVSRNPMYIGYFIYFLGCVLLTHSLILLTLLVIFQVSAHWIVLSEERWCVQEFGEEYINYMNKVRRYL
ncbi:isoprenylcysteine carboxylmethyltransferase family protein [Sporolactobacillus shoreae]|uniref:Isoprenylcysteine carboxylmethyltransferase family protein n=1 Tax=Sporolactobacillus shoreae TaxID=1465501 RepID=A0A4Z0GMZ8_9BACL|nr:isoprenylcysteine carboxylmethyltransferase family protein [Sporolactobacillus shoreae]TGA98444.1 isoprenylcysteine carboxylmethyltransferase family protein [Sporolactobacillus shoreae]